VPIGYLVTTVVAGWMTLFAVAPLRRPFRLARLSWGFGFLINELPFIAIYWLLASTLLALGQGDVDTPVGRVALGLAVLTTAGLVVVAARGLRARPAIEVALVDGLGAGWRTALDPSLSARLRSNMSVARILFGAFLRRRRDVERVANISYGDAGKRNLLDVYRHRSHPSGGPTLIYLHGGGFYSGRKNREARPLLYRLASQGWVCISANYRLAPSARFPDYLIDVKKVIAWVREHGQEYGADPSVLFVAGSSAGAHLAAMVASTPNDPDFQPGFEQVDTTVAAAVGLYGYYGSVDGTPSSSPHAYVGVGAPPFFVVHGDLDTHVLVEGAREFVAALRSASASPVVYAELPGAQHSFDLFASPRFEAVVDGIEAFATWVRSTRAPRGK
jgi:acetyl esterase/lipase